MPPGTGAAPVLASMAKEMGILTVGIVTTPFKFEGPRRSTQAAEGIKELQDVVDTLIVIDNNNLHKILGSSVTMKKAFEELDLRSQHVHIVNVSVNTPCGFDLLRYIMYH